MNIFTTEIFGPVIACYSFSSTQEVIDRANNTEYGLQSYVYSKVIRRANHIADVWRDEWCASPPWDGRVLPSLSHTTGVIVQSHGEPALCLSDWTVTASTA